MQASARKANQEFDEENAVVSTKIRQITDSHGFHFYIQLWIWISFKALAVCIPIVTMFWIYCLPAMMLCPDLVQAIKFGLYMQVGLFFAWFFFFGFVAFYWVVMFGWYFCKQALLFCWLPAMIVGSIVNSMMDLGFYGTIYDVVFVIISIYFVSKVKLPENPSLLLLDQFERKSAIAKPLVKMIIVLGVVYFILQNLFKMFLYSEFLGRVFIRFGALPLLTSICASFQTHFLKSVQQKHNEYALALFWISSGHLKIFERIFTNSMFNSGDYFSFILWTFAAAVIEILNHAIYFQRISLAQKALSFMKRINQFNIPFLPRNYADSRTDVGPGNPAQSQSHEMWVMGIRKKMIIEDISIELVMIFTVTFLLYFAAPLAQNDRFETIPSFEICIIQLLIQVFFEMISDVFGLYWTISKQNIPLRVEDIELKSKWYWTWMFFMFYQTFLIFYYMLYF